MAPLGLMLLGPAGASIPLRDCPLRFAACIPDCRVTRSWRVWSQRDEVYIACRDAAPHVHVSLHPSGEWHFTFDKKAVDKFPGLLPAGASRVLTTWARPVDADSRTVIGARIAFAPGTADLLQSQRKVRRPEILMPFPSDQSLMPVVTVCVCPNADPVVHSELESVVIGVIGLPGGQSVQLLLTHEPSTSFVEYLRTAFHEASASGKMWPPSGNRGVFLVHDFTEVGIPFFAAVPYSVSLTRDSFHTVPLMPPT